MGSHRSSALHFTRTYFQFKKKMKINIIFIIFNLVPALVSGLRCLSCARGGRDCSITRVETCHLSSQFCLRVSENEQLLSQKCYDRRNDDSIYGTDNREGCKEVAGLGYGDTRTVCLCDSNLCNSSARESLKILMIIFPFFVMFL